MEYRALDSARNEIRLLDILPLGAGQNIQEGKSQSPDIICCTMENVSLDEFTSESREFMVSEGLDTYTGVHFWQKMLAVVYNDSAPPDPVAGRPRSRYVTTADKINGNVAKPKELASQPESARWAWGDFMALSYTWGSAQPSREIIINGNFVKVTENLESFLRRIRDDISIDREVGKKAQRIWIDALCINQEDIEERSLQVKRMADIYQQALFVYLWLGEEAEDSSQAMNMLATIGACANYEWKLSDGSDLRNAMYDEDFFPIGSWTALCMLLNRPYWKRLWVIQEIALSSGKMTVVCGDCHLEWSCMMDALSFLSNDLLLPVILYGLENEKLGLPPSAYSSVKLIPSLTKVQELGIFEQTAALARKPYILPKLLALMRSAEQSDPRDKVYGILSLLDPLLAQLITPDYNNSVYHVYVEFAMALICYTGSTDLVCRASRKTTLTLNKYPSWVPDWSSDEPITALGFGIPYNANGSSIASCSIEADGVLVVAGFVIDIVDSMSCGCGGFFEDAVHATTTAPNTSPQGDINQDVDSSRKQRSNVYSDQGVEDALWRTITSNRDMDGNTAPDGYKAILDIPRQLNKPGTVDIVKIYWNFMQLFFRCHGSFVFDGKPIRDYFPVETHRNGFVMDDVTTAAVKSALTSDYMRRLIGTKDGYLGWGPYSTEVGDKVCILFGTSFPVLLRPNDDGYQIVGETYIHGIMEGEALELLKDGTLEVENFRIV